jgi:hypothetical protein
MAADEELKGLGDAGDFIGPRDENGACAAQAHERLTEESTGMNVVKTEWVGRVDQYEVKVARELAMLETIVEDEHVHVGPPGKDGHAALESVGVSVDGHRDAAGSETLLEHPLLVAQAAGGLVAT